MTVPGPCNAQVLLKYHHKFFNVGWGITNTPWHIYRMLTQFANFLEVGQNLSVYSCPQQQMLRSWPAHSKCAAEHRGATTGSRHEPLTNVP